MTESNGIGSPRMWIYVAMLVGGMIWGIHLIYTTMY